jgi:hypothetical protein
MLNTSAEYKLKVYDSIRDFRSRATIEMDAFAKQYFSGIRYVRDWLNGSTANDYNFWNAINIFSGSVNLSTGLTPTTNNSYVSNIQNILDGSNTTYGNTGIGLSYMQVDLGVIRYDIDKIQVIHFYADGRTFNETKTEVSADGVTWITLRDSAIDGTYAETAEGQIFLPNKEITKVFNDNKIVRMKILEEMSTLNESLPSNELQLTLDNTEGEFDLLNVANMHEIIASKPVIKTELGLLLYELPETDIFVSDFRNKVHGSTIENPNRALYLGKSTLPGPDDFSAESSQSAIDNLGTINQTYATVSSPNGLIPHHAFRFDIIEILERRYGQGIWMGETTLAGKVALAEKYCYKLTGLWYGYGTSPTGNIAYLRMGSNTTSWFGTTRSHTKNTSTALSIATYSTNYAIGSDGFVTLGVYSALSDATKNSEIRTDYVELQIEVHPFEAIEWKPTGTYFLSEWNNEVTNKIITLIAHDYFNLFSEISYEPTGITNLKSLAQDVLTKGGVPVANQKIDESLAAITVNPFPERIDIRTALQYIGIASGSAVSQDREGNVFIKPFRTIDEASNYIVYATKQGSLFGHVGYGIYPLNDSGGGMKYLDFNQMYEAPKVGLDKSIYQLVVRVYTNGVSTERVYTNSFINGSSGQSFTIDNPLIKTAAQADKVAEWYMKEKNYNATYSVRWRGNPALECADIILVEDSFNAEKQTRIIRQELNFNGYLEGITESRGGV